MRAFSETSRGSGAPQPGLPSPAAVPQGYCVIVIDLQDCFFTINLDPKDLPSVYPQVIYKNLKKINKKSYHKGWKNSPTLCQKFVTQAIKATKNFLILK